MTKELFPAYANLISKAISKTDNAEEHIVANTLIDHMENDLLYFQIPGKEERIEELREQLQERSNELKRQIQDQKTH